MSEKYNEHAKHLFELLDSYLIGDLDTMIYDVPAKPSGGLGYPAMQTLLSGMELLGFLLSGGLTDRNAFYYFWDNEFVKDNPNYDSSKLRDIFKNAIRNKIAHLFLTKFHIQITKEGVGHLSKTREGYLSIDLKTFYEDFNKTYARIRKEMLMNPSVKFNKAYRKLFDDLKTSEHDVVPYIENEIIDEFPKTVVTTSGTAIHTYRSLTSRASITTLPPDLIKMVDWESVDKEN